jgi:putative peptidoglycan lipid II flippase
VIRISLASLALAAISWLVWDALDHALGRSTVAQIISLGAGLTLGAIAYVAAAWMLRIAELEQILRLLRRRRG